MLQLCPRQRVDDRTDYIVSICRKDNCCIWYNVVMVESMLNMLDSDRSVNYTLLYDVRLPVNFWIVFLLVF